MIIEDVARVRKQKFKVEEQDGIRLKELDPARPDLGCRDIQGHAYADTF